MEKVSSVMGIGVAKGTERVHLRIEAVSVCAEERAQIGPELRQACLSPPRKCVRRCECKCLCA